MGETLLKLQDLTVGYHGDPLISEICLEVSKGMIVSLIGPNGAGKSTILRSVMGRLKSLGGAVWLGELDCKTIGRKELAKQMSVLMTGRIDTDCMTAYDVAAMGRYPYTGTMGHLTAGDHEVVCRSMKQVGAWELREQDYATLSDGQRQRVLLARALCQEPAVLILDEPTSFLDIHYKISFMNVLQKLCREQGIGVLMSVHEIELAQQVSHKVACVGFGRVDRIGTPAEIFSDDYLEKLYDLPTGSFHKRTGTAELEAPEGDPKLFVIAGNGTGIMTYRELQRKGIPFAAGILWENDQDHPVAMSLSCNVYSVPAFSSVSDEMIEEVKAAMTACGRVLVLLSETDMRGPAEVLKKLVQYAKEQSLLIEETDGVKHV